MASCHEMKVNEIYVCKSCGLELKVVRCCRDFGKSSDDCGCDHHDHRCELSCCDEPLVKKTDSCCCGH